MWYGIVIHGGKSEELLYFQMEPNLVHGNFKHNQSPWDEASQKQQLSRPQGTFPKPSNTNLKYDHSIFIQ